LSRKFFYHIKKTSEPDGWRYHLYVNASRRFSLNELLAKQHNLLLNLPEIFKEDIEKGLEVKLASCRESKPFQITFFFTEPVSSAFHFDLLKIQEKEIILDYDNILEVVFTDKAHLMKVLKWMKNNWKGEWIKVEYG